MTIGIAALRMGVRDVRKGVGLCGVLCSGNAARGYPAASMPPRLSLPLSPQLTVQRAQLHCLAHVLRSDPVRTSEVGDGAADFEDAVVGAGAEAEVRHRRLQQGITWVGGGLRSRRGIVRQRHSRSP
jgi:hypothetical protein